ncbi:hypothetical protein R1sor_005955 [Riccia sorocarpa]|uniref:Uncharacterized protein n=1 Tax=Riccia sorocarpa TaxID=122646 RepID=A0ABD3HPF4_9MARC
MSSKSSNTGGNSSSKGGAKTPNSSSSSRGSGWDNPPKNVNEVYKAWGGFQNFMLSYGLKMWNHENVEEAKAIAEAMCRVVEDSGENHL